MNEKDFFNSIDRFLAGKASKRDIATLQKFELFAEDKNKDTVFRDTIEKQKIKHQIRSNINKRITSKRRFFIPTAVAASLLLLLGSSLLLIYTPLFNKKKDILVENKQETPKRIILPDFSEVTLNSNSSLAYTTDYNKEKRNIKLIGEAIFKVKSNDKKPFIIKTGKLTTQVVGTLFSIKETDSIINVSVMEGQVKVFHSLDTLHLKQSERAIFNQHSSKLKEENVNTEILNLWARETIVLKNISYKDLAEVFFSLYNYTIQFQNEEVATTRLSVAFDKAENIEDIIERVNMINKVKLILKPNHMIIAE